MVRQTQTYKQKLGLVDTKRKRKIKKRRLNEKYKTTWFRSACGTSSGNGSNLENSRLVRLVNTGTTVRLVTLETSGNVTIGTFSLVGGEEEFLKKGKTDEIFAASAEVKGVGVGF